MSGKDVRMMVHTTTENEEKLLRISLFRFAWVFLAAEAGVLPSLFFDGEASPRSFQAVNPGSLCISTSVTTGQTPWTVVGRADADGRSGARSRRVLLGRPS